MINGNLEKRIIDVINDHKKQNDDKGMISRRLTAKKLQVEFKIFSNNHCLFIESLDGTSKIGRDTSH